MKTAERDLIAKVPAGITCLWLDSKHAEVHATVAACFASYVNGVMNYRGPRRAESLAKLKSLDDDIAYWLKGCGYRIVKRGRHWMNEFVPSLAPAKLATA